MRKVSEYLKEERLKKKLTLEDIHTATKIKVQYLQSIEDGKFYLLPSESYALGFVKSYASHLDLPIDKVTAYFRREYEGEKREVLPKFRSTQEQFRNRFFLDAKKILIFCVLLIIISYIIFQYSSLFLNPKLEIATPRNGEVLDKNVVIVEGKTDQDALLTIDGDETFVEYDGTFRKSMYVFSGEKKIIIVSKNRFGRVTKQEVTIRVK